MPDTNNNRYIIIVSMLAFSSKHSCTCIQPNGEPSMAEDSYAAVKILRQMMSYVYYKHLLDLEGNVLRSMKDGKKK